jgi:hypothetical protein
MTKFKLINTMLLFAVLSGNLWADSKAVYDSKTKTLSLEGVLVPFIDEFTGKETDNKGFFDAQLQEKTKLVFELIPWSINFKNTFDGENTSGYILYDYKTRSVNIPCFEVTTIAKFGDGIEGETIYYKDVSMKQRHVAYPIFHVDDMTKTDSCESSIIPEPQKPSLTTTPTTTKKDSVEVEVNGKVGTAVFVNGVDSGKTIGLNGKVKLTLDTSGDGDKSFSISLKDSAGNESEALSFSITKQQAITLTSMAVLSADDSYHDNFMKKGFDIYKISAKHQVATLTRTFPFNKEMMIDLGLIDDGYQSDKKLEHKKNTSAMWLGSWSTDSGSITINFKDENGTILHTFEFRKSSGGYHNSYISLDDNKHSDNQAKYQISIFGYIFIKNGKLLYSGEYRYHNGIKWDGLGSKTWNLANFNKIKKAEITISARATYNAASIPLYIEY